jgi:tetratricopeptide (TPR) repeat protein
MAVFGIPVVHEDDALRAARAALELRRDVAELGIDVRIGINTGEVVAAEGETLVTGDAVNVAARLEQAAEPGEILIGGATHRLARTALLTEEVAPVEAKGKTEPVVAWRLVGVIDDAPAFTRMLDAPFVGRGHELEQLLAAFDRAVTSSCAQRVTVLGDPGIGKSRIARELVQRLEGRARVVVGRCVAYGEGITYWPRAEIVHASAGGDREAIRAVVADDLAADRIAAAIGVGDELGTKEETQWAARRFLEALASELPLIAVLDDLHWAEPTFLDLVEYVADFAEAPILLLCSARPELLDTRPGWTSPRSNAVVLVLEPLPAEDANALVRDVDDATRGRILAAAEGNPLFVEQLLALHGEGNGELVVPPTIQALLAARIDSLAAPERIVECASVEGRLFHRGAVAELAPEDLRRDVGAHLLALVRKEFVRPDRSQLPGDDGYRFAHILVRDAAYEAMPKELRADLHERFVDWLERVTSERLGELDEILGYHLEQAALYRRELAIDDQSVSSRAVERLARSGTRAYDRGDLHAARNLLERATALAPHSDPARVRALPLLGMAIFHSGGEMKRALAVLEQAIEEGQAGGDRGAEASAWAMSWIVRLQTLVGTDVEDVRRDFERRAPEIEALGDARALVCLFRLQLTLANMAGRYAEVHDAAERLLEAARAAGDRPSFFDAIFFLSADAFFGSNPVEQGLAQCEQLQSLAEGPVAKNVVEISRGALLGLRGDLPDARRAIATARAGLADFGLRLHSVSTGLLAGLVELHSGEYAEAERLLRETCDELREVGESGYLSTDLAYLGEALYGLGRYEEAEQASRESERLTQAGDKASELCWRALRAKVLARRGEHDEALRLAREAVAVAEAIDSNHEIADVWRSLAEVHRLSGDVADAVAALERAVALYEEKGLVPAIRRTRAALAELRS